MLQPQEPVESFSTEVYGGRRLHQVDGGRVYPPIISSAVSLEVSSPAVSSEGWRRASAIEPFDQPQARSPLAAAMMQEFSVEPRTATFGRKSQWYAAPAPTEHLQKGPLTAETSEAQELLRLNL